MTNGYTIKTDESRSLSETAQNIADMFRNMVMERGYNAVSYGDLAKELGIRTASIHYHFPTKAELGFTVIRRYRDNFEGLWEEASKGNKRSYVIAYESFITPIKMMRDMENASCLFGVLGAEYKTLCPEIQGVVADFFKGQSRWLENVFDGGRKAGAFKFSGSAISFAELYGAALQGAMLIKKSTNNPQHFDAVLRHLELIIYFSAFLVLVSFLKSRFFDIFQIFAKISKSIENFT